MSTRGRRQRSHGLSGSHAAGDDQDHPLTPIEDHGPLDIGDAGTSAQRSIDSDATSTTRVGIYKKAKGGFDFTSGETSNAIRDGMLARVNDFWPTFKQIPDEVKNVMFEEFVNSFLWKDDVSRADVKKLWKIKAGTKYREWVYQMHKYRVKHDGLAQEIFDQFLAYWESPDFKSVSARNASSRNQNPMLHCGGSWSYADYRNDLYAELHREPSSWEIYCKTHKVESADGSTTSGWIDAASTEFATKFQDKIDELSSQGMDVTQDLEETVFSEISTSLAKRMDRRPNYGNIPTKQRRRDRATSSSNDDV